MKKIYPKAIVVCMTPMITSNYQFHFAYEISKFIKDFQAKVEFKVQNYKQQKRKMGKFISSKWYTICQTIVKINKFWKQNKNERRYTKWLIN